MAEVEDEGHHAAPNVARKQTGDTTNKFKFDVELSAPTGIDRTKGNRVVIELSKYFLQKY